MFSSKKEDYCLGKGSYFCDYFDMYTMNIANEE